MFTRKNRSIKVILIIFLVLLSIIPLTNRITSSQATYNKNNWKRFTGYLRNQGYQSGFHQFTVPEGTIRITIQLTVPSGADFDLSLYDRYMRRTGGYIRGSHLNSYRIPGAYYAKGGYGRSETITLSLSGGAARFSVSCYAFRFLGSYSVTVSLTMEGNGIPEKIAVFFYATDFTKPSVMANCFLALNLGQGYTKVFYFRNTVNYRSCFSLVDRYESAEDTLFVAFFAHGERRINVGNGLSPETTFVDLDGQDSQGKNRLYAPMAKQQMDKFESKEKMVYVEACRAGGFKAYFNKKPYICVTSTDTLQLAHNFAPGDPRNYYWHFSFFMFQAYFWGLSHKRAYQYAWSNHFTAQDPYIFQNPQYHNSFE